MKYITSILLSILILTAVPVSAQEFKIENPSVSDYIWGSGKVFKLQPQLDIPLLAGSAAVAISGLLCEYLVEKPHPETLPLDINQVNPFDRPMARPYNRALDITGSVTNFLALAMPAVLFALPATEWSTFLTMYLESALFALGFRSIGKAFTYRERPYTYFENYPTSALEDGDFARSFPSGHTTMAFVGATFAAYVFCMYYPDSIFKIPVIAASSVFAVGTGALRILSGNHFMTDVLAGAAIGGLCGFLVPFVHTINAGIAKSLGNENGEAPIELNTLSGGISIRFKW